MQITLIQCVLPTGLTVRHGPITLNDSQLLLVVQNYSDMMGNSDNMGYMYHRAIISWL